MRLLPAVDRRIYLMRLNRFWLESRGLVKNKRGCRAQPPMPDADVLNATAARAKVLLE
jgi:hypothetical protein